MSPPPKRIAVQDANRRPTRCIGALYTRKLSVVGEPQKSLLHQAFTGED